MFHTAVPARPLRDWLAMAQRSLLATQETEERMETRWKSHDSWKARSTALARAIWLAVGLFLALWFLDTITVIVLLLLFAIILAMALNPPITWLEAHRLPRVVGTLLVLAGVVAVVALLGWLIVPRLIEQGAALVTNLPDYAGALTSRVADWLTDYPALQEQVENLLRPDATLAEQALPQLQAVLARVGQYTLSVVGVAIFLVVLISLMIYLLVQPRPLLHGLLTALPLAQRDPTARALVRASQMVSAWLWSNVIVGAIEAVAVAIALSLLGVPGAFVWAALAFFAELVPKIGLYLMAAPPSLVALAVDPWTALWVLLFYLVLDEIMSDVVTPIVRGSRMDIHPVILLFAALAMVSAFGLLGALIATPLAGIIKAFYAEFYLSRQPADDRLNARVEQVLHRQGPGDEAAA